MVAIANVGPPLGLAYEAWRRGQLSDAEFQTALRRTGLEPAWFPALEALKNDRLDLGAIATAVHRGIMDDNSRMVKVFDLVLELAVIRMNAPVAGPAGRAYYPRMCLWVDAQTRMVLSFEMVPPGEDPLGVVFESLQALPDKIGGWYEKSAALGNEKAKAALARRLNQR